MILNVLDKYICENYDYKYYNFGFDVDLNKIINKENDYHTLYALKSLSGQIHGDKGDLQHVKSNVYLKNIDLKNILFVMGQLKIKSNVSYKTYNMSVSEIVLDIYNNALMNLKIKKISKIDVIFNNETENFN